ncbi:SPRY domain-containing SOCS box protein 3-like isoform X2 [Sinocyclocheilus rhinocerous]|uniref:SPRY domain-containing SOCS box protein 3-like isoform X2 n=1 Tax=Sinocyclocheilus rhinocerous TaxID=307959 RepID=UPI0007B8E45D|nr:PREDICTED: SPRY domain-containing SOCS box protein 3-like isoform X2 [Sinocyclocheilus rhinocerous]
MLRSFRGHTWENWEWDPDSKSPDAHLSLCRQAVYFHISPLLDSQGTAGVRGTNGIDSESWGLSYKGFVWHNGRSRKYTEPFYERNTVIGVLLDLSAGTLTFFRNGVNLGVAFTGLEQVSKALYPLVSSTAPETELQLGVRSQRISSLQEQCIHIITRSLSHYRHAHELPLPTPLLCQIRTHAPL